MKFYNKLILSFLAFSLLGLNKEALAKEPALTADKEIVVTYSESDSNVLIGDSHTVFYDDERYYGFQASTGTIKSYIGDATNLEVPSEINGITVKAIAPYVFSNMELETVILPKNIEVIGAYAFKDNNLATLTLPKSLKSINWGAFQNNNLSTIKLKEKTSLIISDYAFKGNRFTMVKLNKTTSYAKMSFDETVTLLK